MDDEDRLSMYMPGGVLHPHIKFLSSDMTVASEELKRFLREGPYPEVVTTAQLSLDEQREQIKLRAEIARELLKKSGAAPLALAVLLPMVKAEEQYVLKELERSCASASKTSFGVKIKDILERPFRKKDSSQHSL